MHFVCTCVNIYFFLHLVASKAYHKKKNVKVIEDEICGKLFEIYNGTEKNVLVKFVEAIPFRECHFF